MVPRADARFAAAFFTSAIKAAGSTLPIRRFAGVDFVGVIFFSDVYTRISNCYLTHASNICIYIYIYIYIYIELVSVTLPFLNDPPRIYVFKYPNENDLPTPEVLLVILTL